MRTKSSATSSLYKLRNDLHLHSSAAFVQRFRCLDLSLKNVEQFLAGNNQRYHLSYAFMSRLV